MRLKKPLRLVPFVVIVLLVFGVMLAGTASTNLTHRPGASINMLGGSAELYDIRYDVDDHQVSFRVKVTDVEGIAQVNSATLWVQTWDPVAKVVSEADSAVTAAVAGQEIHWTVTNHTLPTGKEFFGMRVEGEYVTIATPAAHTYPFESGIGAASP